MDSLSPKRDGPAPRGLAPIGPQPQAAGPSPAKARGLDPIAPQPKPVAEPMAPATKRKLGIALVAGLAIAGIVAAVVMGGGHGGGPTPAPQPVPVVQAQVAPQPVGQGGGMQVQAQPHMQMQSPMIGTIGSIRETSPPGGPMWGFWAELATANETVQVIGNNGSDLVSSTSPVVGWRFVGFSGPNCAAVRAGCQLGDIMLSYRGERTAEDPGVVCRIHASGTEKPLDPIEVVVIRNGQRLTLTGPVGYVSSQADLHP